MESSVPIHDVGGFRRLSPRFRELFKNVCLLVFSLSGHFDLSVDHQISSPIGSHDGIIHDDLTEVFKGPSEEWLDGTGFDCRDELTTCTRSTFRHKGDIFKCCDF